MYSKKVEPYILKSRIGFWLEISFTYLILCQPEFLDVSIWLELINVNVTLDVRAIPRQVALVLPPRLTDANLNSADLMPSAYPKTELEDASAFLDTLMETLRPVVHLDLEVGKYFLLILFNLLESITR